jgi:hypothetical protein
MVSFLTDANVQGGFVNRFKGLALGFVVVLLLLAASAPNARAQVSVSVGVAPDCPYGYYDVAPYGCAPYGYYGPEWFTGGVFIGAGPWFHGPENFHGNVNNHYHPDHGYKGPAPHPGDKPEASKPVGKVAHFKGNEVRDGHGNVSGGKH